MLTHKQFIEICRSKLNAAYAEKVCAMMGTHGFKCPNTDPIQFLSLIVDDPDGFKKVYTGKKLYDYPTLKVRLNALQKLCTVPDIQNAIGEKCNAIHSAIENFKTELRTHTAKKKAEITSPNSTGPQITREEPPTPTPPASQPDEQPMFVYEETESEHHEDEDVEDDIDQYAPFSLPVRSVCPQKTETQPFAPVKKSNVPTQKVHDTIASHLRAFEHHDIPILKSLIMIIQEDIKDLLP